MSSFVLHCIAQSGNCYKPALMLALAQADWRPRFVDYFNGETRTQEFLRLNPMGEIPVLEHNAQCINQSGVILSYLQETLDFLPGTDPQSDRDVLRWLLFDNHKLTGYCATLRFLRTFTDNAEPAVIAFFEGRAKGALQVLENHLERRDFVINDQLTIADLSLCGYLYFQDEIGIDFAHYPAIKRWLGNISQLEG